MRLDGIQELNKLQDEYLRAAEQLPNYKDLTKTELANGYCDAEEAMWKAQEEGDEALILKYDMLRGQYFAALMIRYWYKIWQWMRDSASLGLEPIDFVNWLVESLFDMGAFYYKTWRYEYKARVEHGRFIEWILDENGDKIINPYYWKLDPNAPDKIINRCCMSVRGRMYQYYNKDRRKGNVAAFSLDDLVNENGDCSIEWAGCISEPDDNNDVSYIIDALFKKGEHLEALVVDGIANWDTYKETKHMKEVTDVDDETGEEYSETIQTTTTEFDKRKLVKHLNSINQDFINRFCRNYSASYETAEKLFTKLQKMSNTKLYKLIEKTLIELRNNPDLIDCNQ